MFENVENKFVVLTHCELEYVEGGSIDWKVVPHKVIDSTGKFFGGIYNAGRSFGKNWYNANN